MPRLRPILEYADKAKIATSPSSEVITVNLVFCHNGPIAEGLSSNIAVRGLVRSILWKVWECNSMHRSQELGYVQYT
jgi:hypothetical protein